MSRITKHNEDPPERGLLGTDEGNIAENVSNVTSGDASAKNLQFQRVSSSTERQMKFERAQKCLENAASVSKRIKEHRKATAELLGKPFEEDDGGDTASEMASTMSERTGFSTATDVSTLSVQDALNIPGISESLANTLKQKEILMEKIKQYKEISKKPMKSSPSSKKEISLESKERNVKVAESTYTNQLQQRLKEKDNALSIMQVKMKAMETTILDLQEKIGEKDQIIEAKTKATSLLSDLSKKDKDSLDLLEDTRQQMVKMQENFITMEAEWNNEKTKLLEEIKIKDQKINNLEENNLNLQNKVTQISSDLSYLTEELQRKNKEIDELQSKLNESLNFEQIGAARDDEEKGSKEIAQMEELTKKVELLEKLNCQLRQVNKELENRLASVNIDNKTATGSPSKKASPIPSRKGARNTASKSKSPWSSLSSESLSQEPEKKHSKNDQAKMEILVQSLNKDILEKEYSLNQTISKLEELEKTIVQKDAIISEITSKLEDETKKISEMSHTESEWKDISIDFSQSQELTESRDYSSIEQPIEEIKQLENQLKQAKAQIALLNEEIESSNKNMIKVKSNHKLKVKQMQKTIDNLSKVSDANSEIIKLNEEIHLLTQKVAELEEEKGNLQLHLVDYDSGRLTESEAYKKLIEIESLAESRLKSISTLETQKFDLVQELHDLQQKNSEMEDKLADLMQLQNEHLCSEIQSAELEEQIEHLMSVKKELEALIKTLNVRNDKLRESVNNLQNDKEELNIKLEHYINENLELSAKLEKLKSEKVSSAESIEIVEGLTSQEKLELEEYNNSKTESTQKDEHQESQHGSSVIEEKNEIQKLVLESAELNKKIELFTLERQEVMEKLNALNSENESLQQKIYQSDKEIGALKNNIELLNMDKANWEKLNEELIQQIEDLKNQRIEVMKGSTEHPKQIDDTSDVVGQELYHDEKVVGDKGNNKGTKSVKQLTKDIIKLKCIIKEREDEIADCQVKILSLEEQQQKQAENMQTSLIYEEKIKGLIEENNYLKGKNTLLEKDSSETDIPKQKQEQEFLQQEINRMQNEYSAIIKNRDVRIQELEDYLIEYEKQINNYNNQLQHKDKEINDYLNQLTKLNEVSQKLKSTIELLEEEKAKDQNVEIIKSLNTQINIYQCKLTEYEEKLRNLEDEKSKFSSAKNLLENKNKTLEVEVAKLQEIISEKSSIITAFKNQQEKHSKELSMKTQELKERDEEIHEVKLQLRKESIENEKLRNIVEEKESSIEASNKELISLKEKIESVRIEKGDCNELFAALEIKNKELMEKLKKVAGNLKKKTILYGELETRLNNTQAQLDSKLSEIEQLKLQVESLPALQDKLKCAEEEITRILEQKRCLEQQTSQYIYELQDEKKTLNEKLCVIDRELQMSRENNDSKESLINALNKKIAELEIELKNNTNLVTKISSLENEIHKKELQITELINNIENESQSRNQLSYGYEAKIQEQYMYIENLETEIAKYKNRISRLEESVSLMEDSRHSLEKKAHYLDYQLQEKQKAYHEYTNQEDELVTRLAVLIDHDRVLDKQVAEINAENKNLQSKVQILSSENQQIQQALSEIGNECQILREKAIKADSAESDCASFQIKITQLETEIKKLNKEYQSVVTKHKKEFEELEVDFNMQIENGIKEKKTLMETNEKSKEHINILELKLEEYRTTIQTLQINLDELSRFNQELALKLNSEKSTLPDYTEQYITEINKLNSVINNKNYEITSLTNNLQSIQSSLEKQINKLGHELETRATELQALINQNNILEKENNSIKIELNKRDIEIKKLIEEKKVTFELNIPKTEGMIISSTIESLAENPIEPNLASLESQIVSSDATDNSTREDTLSIEKNIEPLIVRKNSYLCYESEDNLIQKEVAAEVEVDPFNSDDGWGFGEVGDQSHDVIHDFSQFNNEIVKLKADNEKLRTDLSASNTKVLKAMKKLKELKATNEMLSNELKSCKQASQCSLLDNTIEDELKLRIKDLEKTVLDLSAELNKEKREKENLKKQNEVFNNANDRFIELKEKMDSEVQLWKFKCKEANDKLETVQWGTDSKTPELKVIPLDSAHIRANEDIVKLEKENDELHFAIEQLSNDNKILLEEQSRLRTEVSSLCEKLDLEKRSNDLQSTIDQLISDKRELVDEQSKLKNEILSITEKQQCSLHEFIAIKQNFDEATMKISELKLCNESIQKKYDDLNTEYIEKQKHYEIICQNLNEKCIQIEKDCTYFKQKYDDADAKLQKVMAAAEYDQSKTLLPDSHSLDQFFKPSSSFINTEKSSENDNKLMYQMQSDFECQRLKITELESEKQERDVKMESLEQTVQELQIKLQNLNKENDELLSSLTELRSTITAAVDQRGFEIAELWKQHLSQRETEFQKLEQDLRTALSSSESKYEQLLDKFQTSNQEETNKIVINEQLNALQLKIQDKDEHLANLQIKYAESMNQLDILRAEIEDEKLMLENKILTQQEDYETQIKLVTEKLNKQATCYELKLKELQSESTDFENKISKLMSDLEESLCKKQELEINVVNLTNELRIKETEVNQKTNEYKIALDQRNQEFEIVRNQLIVLEKKVEDLTYEKEAELAVLRLKVHENTKYYEEKLKESDSDREVLTEELNAKIIECNNLSRQISELNKLLNEHSAKTSDMQLALENQELEIVTLKDEIDKLQNILTTSHSRIAKHVTFSSDTKDGDQHKEGDEKFTELLDPVPRAELDLALYMLHQRDVRCEELTMELTRLLEERDTLQLRLSDSLRTLEDIKAKSALPDSFLHSKLESMKDVPTLTIESEQQFVDTHRAQSSRNTSVSEGDNPGLQAKLSELRSVHHSRDVRYRQDSEQRQMDMMLFQRDIANLPPEAVEHLQQARHTLSRDSQSASSTFLNWIRGKSTPKAVQDM